MGDYNVAIASLIGTCLTLSIFLASRRHLLAPHCFTSSILLHSLLAPLAAILLYFQLISCYWQKVIHTFGVFSVQISSALMALSLILIIKHRPIGKFTRLLFIVSPPVISASVILLASLRRLYN